MPPVRLLGPGVRLADGEVGLRPLRIADGRRWIEIRARNADWLAPWEVTPPGRLAPDPPSWRVYLTALRRLRQQQAAGTALPLAVTLSGRLVGQVTAGAISGTPVPSAYVGYWLDRAVAGRGVMPTALALVIDYCFDVLGLQRIEANIRPENVASRRVVDKLGFRAEQLRTRYLHVAGEWRDHICYVITPEDVPEGMVARWHSVRR